mgnify:CR=1 FL=1
MADEEQPMRTKRFRKPKSLFAIMFGMIFTLVIIIILALIVISALHNQKIIDLSNVIDFMIEKDLWFDWFEYIIVPRENTEISTENVPTPTPT